MTVDLKVPVGRSDLAWILSCQGEEQQQNAWIRFCGFELKETKEEKSRGKEAGSISTREIKTEWVDKPTAGQHRLAFWRITKTDFSDEEESAQEPAWFRNAKPLTREDLFVESEKLPYPFLTPWSRLWPFLKSELSRFVPGHQLDAVRLVRQISECKPIRHLPKIRMRKWFPSIHLLLDTSEPLAPFYRDMNELMDRLQAFCGKHRLTVFVFPSGFDSSCFRLDRDELPRRYEVDQRQTAVLALSDMGALSADRQTHHVLYDLGQSAIKNGGRAIALVPCPSWRWQFRLGDVWRMAWWDMARKPVVQKRRNKAGISHPGKQPGQTDDPYKKGLNCFKTLMSPVLRADTNLIRHIRCLVFDGKTDAGMESKIYTGQIDCRPNLEDLFSEAIPPLVRQKLAKILIACHSDFWDICSEELTTLNSLDSSIELPETVERFNANLAASLNDQAWKRQGFSENEMLGYMSRREKRLPDTAYLSPKIAAQWVLLHRNKEGKLEQSESVPRSLPLNKVAWALKTGKRQTYFLYQRQQHFTVHGVEPLLKTQVVSYLGPVSTTTGSLFIKSCEPTENGKSIHWNLMDTGPELLTHRFENQSYEVESPGVKLHLEQLTRPDWASEIGRNKLGLFVRLEDDRLFYWLSPGRFNTKEGRMTSKDSARGFNQGFDPGFQSQDGRNPPAEILTKGCWLPEKIYQTYRKEDLLPSDGRSHLGEDEFGLYEDIYIQNVCQRLRWIEPGEFLMGSPEDEPERSENETQHRVTLTKGFWLADTACTQELWEAVMGENPSDFKGANRPVDSVSYEDCQRFLAKANRKNPQLALSLPTEAQWEYACRAGTQTPFYFGDHMNTDQVNYDGEYPYHDGKKGKDRKETVEVKELPANAWGLYQMHGNVLEWCSDWYGEYGSEPSINPEGPVEGGFRVLRGGSWLDYGRSCRSAYRNAIHPGYGHYDIGFRLSRGQWQQGKKK